MNVLEASLNEIVRRHESLRTTFDVDEYVFDAIRMGASGFLVKDTEPAELSADTRWGSASASSTRRPRHAGRSWRCFAQPPR